MWHSIPAALIAGLATFLVCLSPDLSVRIFKAWAVVIGFVSHLILDEIYAVDWAGRSIRIKKSFGTALKLFGGTRWAIFTTYAKLVLLTAMVAGDASFMNHYGKEPLDIPFTAQTGSCTTSETMTPNRTPITITEMKKSGNEWIVARTSGMCFVSRLEDSGIHHWSSKQFSTVQQNRHGSVVNQIDFHIGLKLPGLDMGPLLSRFCKNST